MPGSPYRIMWLVVMFDLPTGSKAERKAYQAFHKFLLKDGFTQMQYSIYIRCCASPENMEAHLGRIQGRVPHEGEVRILELTDKQFGRMHVFQGKMRKEPEKGMTQLELF